jgi:hypothetical protein
MRIKEGVKRYTNIPAKSKGNDKCPCNSNLSFTGIKMITLGQSSSLVLVVVVFLAMTENNFKIAIHNLEIKGVEYP